MSFAGAVARSGDNIVNAGELAADIVSNSRSWWGLGGPNTKEIAADIADIAFSDPNKAADVLEAIKGRLSVSQQQNLVTDIADAVGERQARGGPSPAGLSRDQVNLALDLGQITLDLVGLADPTPVSDGVNGLISLFRGDFLGAGISAVSMLPYLGDAAKLGKFGKWAETVANAAEMIGKYGADSAVGRQLLPALEKITNAVDAIPAGVFNNLPIGAQKSLLGMRTSLDTALSRVGLNAASDPGSLAHKAQRWDDYQARGGEWSFERWSTSYDNNMVRARQAHAAVNDYHSNLGWGSREVTVDVNLNGESVRRRLDIADVDARRGVEFKTGYQTHNEANRFEIARDAELVKRGWSIEWTFQGTASKPLLDALDNAGIRYKFVE